METLLAWVLAAATQVTDTQGHPFPASALSKEAATAIAVGCTEHNPFPEDSTGRKCAAVLLVQAARESGYMLNPCTIHGDTSNPARRVCDNGRARGPFQEWSGGKARDASWKSSVDHFLGTVDKAAKLCPAHPIAPLATAATLKTPCPSVGVAIDVRRMKLVDTLIAEVPYSSETATKESEP